MWRPAHCALGRARQTSYPAVGPTWPAVASLSAAPLALCGWRVHGRRAGDGEFSAAGDGEFMGQAVYDREIFFTVTTTTKAPPVLDGIRNPCHEGR